MRGSCDAVVTPVRDRVWRPTLHRRLRGRSGEMSTGTIDAMPGEPPESKPAIAAQEAGAAGEPGVAGTDASGTDATAASPTPRRRRRRRVLLISLVVVLVLVGAAVGGVAFYLRSVETSIPRVDAFSGVPPAARPSNDAPDAMNILVLGSDSRDPGNLGGSRSDTIILAHFPKGRGSAQLISIPRDTWVYVPKSRDGQHGGRNAKINAAYAWGGIPLAVQTVESYTRVRIDHVAIIDFAGFQEIIDALGGIDVQVDETFKSIFPPFRTFTKGTEHMDGATALDYSRQRKQLADGDFARIRHQQQVIKGVLEKAASGGLLSDPGRMNDFLHASAKAISVDKTLSIVDTAVQLRDLRSSNLTFITSPSSRTGVVNDEDVVFPDTAKAKVLFAAVAHDNVSAIMNAAHQQS
jgi:LCP family protein required for cell wall assembly